LAAALPLELQTQVRSLLEVALDPAISPSLLTPFVSLAVSYAAFDPRPEYWQDLLNGDRVPGHAFQALLRIDPFHPRLEGFLVQLWRRVLRKELSLRMPFFVQSWAKRQKDPVRAVRSVLWAILAEAPEFKESLLAECGRYRHSVGWVDFINEYENSAISLTKHLEVDLDGGSAIVNNIFSVLRGTEPTAQITRSSKWFQSGSEITEHTVTIRNASDDEIDELIGEALKRVTSNLMNQIAGKPYIRKSKECSTRR